MFCRLCVGEGHPLPRLIPELMVYLALIVRVSQDFAGLAWVRYDSAFQRQAALTGNTRWSAINTTLYTMYFTGLASARKRCELCLATTHTEAECAQRGDPDPELKDRCRAIESAVLALAKPLNDGPPRAPPPPLARSGEPCRKWNGGGCTFPRCRHDHVCAMCRGNHPQPRCPTRQPQGSQPHPTPGMWRRPGPPPRPY